MKTKVYITALALIAATCNCAIEFEPFETDYECMRSQEIYSRNVWIDDTFTTYETQLIKRGLEKWNRATNGIADYKFSGTFSHMTLTSGTLPDKGKEVWIYRGDSNDPIGVRGVKTDASTGVGRANLSFIHLAMDVLYTREPSDIAMVSIVMHEIGHTMGIMHVNNKDSLMHPLCETSCTDPTLTMYDLNAFCSAAKRGYIKPIK